MKHGNTEDGGVLDGRQPLALPRGSVRALLVAALVLCAIGLAAAGGDDARTAVLDMAKLGVAFYFGQRSNAAAG